MKRFHVNSKEVTAMAVIKWKLLTKIWYNKNKKFDKNLIKNEIQFR